LGAPGLDFETGETTNPDQPRLVTGHEFTRADKAPKMSAGFSPCRIDPSETASFNEFLRRLFSPYIKQ
jgi:hypothetical protein